MYPIQTFAICINGDQPVRGMRDGAVFTQVRLQSGAADRSRSPVKCRRAELARRAETRALPGASFDEDLIRDAVSRLSDRHRAVIYRSLCLRRTTTQIAAELRTDDQRVKQDLHHALHALRETLNTMSNRTVR
jgi:DNA-directed RNA polymerase specialized sigma24 family protein